MFWTAAALLTAIVALTLARPLLRAAPNGAPAGVEHDVEVYKAQLGELDGDLRRGTISASEAESARAEIGRRLLRAAAQTGQGTGAPVRLTPAALGIAVALPLAALGFYGWVGSPQMPDAPLAARADVAPGDIDLQAMIAAAEARLRANPQDGRGWDVLAPVYLRAGDAGKAAQAYRQAIGLLGETPVRLMGLGEALTRGAGGEVTDEAREAFERVAAAEPEMTAPRFFLALDLSQEGRFAEAAEAWRALLETAPADAPWRRLAEDALRDAQAQGGMPSGGPTAAEVAARAAATPQGEQGEMIAGMVAGLAARLEAEPDDAEGWARLVHAYSVLGDRPAASAALARAGETFDPGSPEWRLIETAARNAGIEPSAGEGEARP
ncbi:c-type cytochrome biogenesis protein CcmI [Aureimonas mangrovi]|uniref:c-type cytochrome biogenesis protein CcmI n=1 Tax=Aureimonas mangrovi TaxID=2758041 RepID=UPI00163D8809|nr:c-type cytochrome biogenesis protein CcmI [Aureimonas mangrovi]